MALLPDLYYCGVHPEALYNHARGLIDLVAPPRPGESVYDRAVRTRNVIVEAARSVRDPQAAQALRILLCLDMSPNHRPSWDIPSLSGRRRDAADLHDVQPGTWRRSPQYEARLTVTFAAAVYSRLPRAPGTSSTQHRHQDDPEPAAGPTIPLPDSEPQSPPPPAADPADRDPTARLADREPRRPPPPPGDFQPRGPTIY